MESSMSSFLSATPEALASASADLGKIGDTLRQATSLAGPSTAEIVPLAGDEVSTAVSKLFGSYGQEFQALSAQSAQFHAQFASLLSANGVVYTAEEATNTALTQFVGIAQQFGIFSPVAELTGRPLFGNGTNGAAGTGAHGGKAGWL